LECAGRAQAARLERKRPRLPGRDSRPRLNASEDACAPVSCASLVTALQTYTGNGSPFVSLPKGSSNNPIMKASDVSATGIPIV